MTDSKIQEIEALLNEICWAEPKFFEENSRWVEGGNKKPCFSLTFVLEDSGELRLIHRVTYQGSLAATCRYIPNVTVQTRVDKLIKPLFNPFLEDYFTKKARASTVRLFKEKERFILYKPPSAHEVYKAIAKLQKLDQ